ncbi:MAG: hypothetical protein PUC46_06650 [Lachnospiraceae bacterium]|nr:hypothetical protein [Lachnospiraceae bacterium]
MDMFNLFHFGSRKETQETERKSSGAEGNNLTTVGTSREQTKNETAGTSLERVMPAGSFAGADNKTAGPELTETTPAGHDEKKGWTGLGLSLEDFSEAFERDLAPEISEAVSLKDAEAVSIFSDRSCPGRVFRPEEEIQQRLVIFSSGKISFRSFTYWKGDGHHGIGRMLDTKIDGTAAGEILQMLDTWLFTQKNRDWKKEDTGRWRILVHFQDGRDEMQGGNLEGAFLPDINVSAFIRDRIPISGLILFDEDAADKG